MVELSGKDDPFQHGFPNVVFILPAIIVAGLSGEYVVVYMLFAPMYLYKHRKIELKSKRLCDMWIVHFDWILIGK